VPHPRRMENLFNPYNRLQNHIKLIIETLDAAYFVHLRNIGGSLDYFFSHWKRLVVVESLVTLCACVCSSAEGAARWCVCHCLHDCGLVIYIYIYIYIKLSIWIVFVCVCVCVYIYIYIIKYMNYIFLYFTGVYIINTSMCTSHVVYIVSNFCLLL
jgi:hypothetical protein